MNFVQLINSLDDLLYAVMSWLVFWPLTFWRVVTGPLRSTEYAARELAKTDEKQFEDAISPPLFLLITLLLSHLVAQSLIGDNELIRSRHGLAAFVTDETSLLLVRLFFFGLFPLVMAAHLLRVQRRHFTQSALKTPFFGQCYVTGPFALSYGVAFAVMQFDMHDRALEAPGIAGLALIVASTAWYLKFQTRWFARHLECGLWRGFVHALLGTVESGVLFIAGAALLF